MKEDNIESNYTESMEEEYIQFRKEMYTPEGEMDAPLKLSHILEGIALGLVITMLTLAIVGVFR